MLLLENIFPPFSSTHSKDESTYVTSTCSVFLRFLWLLIKEFSMSIQHFFLIHLSQVLIMMKCFLVFGLFAFAGKGYLSIKILSFISFLIFSEVSSLSCNEGSGMHGMPPALTSHQCPAGVLNCVRILASKSVNDYWIADANSPQTRRATTPRCWAGAVDWRWAGPGVCKVMIWWSLFYTTCDNFSGLPDGIIFDTGEDFSSITTCFCGAELCNTEHWCDGCQVNSSASLLPALASLTLTMMALIASN